MNVYAVAISVNQIANGRTKTIVYPMGIAAESREEAQGVALKNVIDAYPHSNDFWEHQATAVLLSDDFLKRHNNPAPAGQEKLK